MSSERLESKKPRPSKLVHTVDAKELSNDANSSVEYKQLLNTDLPMSESRIKTTKDLDYRTNLFDFPSKTKNESSNQLFQGFGLAKVAQDHSRAVTSSDSDIP